MTADAMRYLAKKLRESQPVVLAPREPEKFEPIPRSLLSKARMGKSKMHYYPPDKK